MQHQWKQRVVFGLTYLCYASIYFTRKPFSVVKTQVGDELSITTSGLGMIDTSFLLLYAVGQFVLTPYGDKLGARRMLCVCFLISAATSLVFAVSSLESTLLFANGINGLVQSVGFPLCVKALTPWFDAESRGMVLGVWTTSQQIGGVLSTSFAGFVAANYGWRNCMAISAVIVAFSGTCLGLCLVEEDPGGNGKSGASSDKLQASNSGIGTNSKPPASKPPSYMKVVMIPGILNLGASYFFIKLARYTLMFWLPFYLAKEHGYGAAEAAYISTLFDFGGVAGSLACGALSDRVFGGKRLLVAGPMCVFTGMLLLAYPGFAGEGITTNCVFLFLIGFNVAGPDSVLGGASTTDVCENNGMLAVLTTACGITNGLGSIGSMLQGPISSIIVGLYGWPGLFKLLGALCVTGVLMLAPLIREQHAAWTR